MLQLSLACSFSWPLFANLSLWKPGRVHFTFRGTLLQLLSRVMVSFCVSDTGPNLEPDFASFCVSLTRIGTSSHFLFQMSVLTTLLNLTWLREATSVLLRVTFLLSHWTGRVLSMAPQSVYLQKVSLHCSKSCFIQSGWKQHEWSPKLWMALNQWLTPVSVDWNHTKGLVNQCVGPFPQSFWFSTSGLGLDHFISYQSHCFPEDHSLRNTALRACRPADTRRMRLFDFKVIRKRNISKAYSQLDLPHFTCSVAAYVWFVSPYWTAQL